MAEGLSRREAPLKIGMLGWRNSRVFGGLDLGDMSRISQHCLCTIDLLSCRLWSSGSLRFWSGQGVADHPERFDCLATLRGAGHCDSMVTWIHPTRQMLDNLVLQRRFFFFQGVRPLEVR